MKFEVKVCYLTDSFPPDLDLSCKVRSDLMAQILTMDRGSVTYRYDSVFSDRLDPSRTWHVPGLKLRLEGYDFVTITLSGTIAEQEA
jgi:hypothetical protein